MEKKKKKRKKKKKEKKRGEKRKKKGKKKEEKHLPHAYLRYHMTSATCHMHPNKNTNDICHMPYI